MSPESLPAIASALLTLGGAVWGAYSLARDKRLKLAEMDYDELHDEVVRLRKRNGELEARIAKAEAESAKH